MSQPQNNTMTETSFRERSGRIGQLKHQFLWCFITIILVTTGVSIALMIELGNGLRVTEMVGQENPVAILRGRIVLGAVLIITVSGGIFLFLHNKIARPMETMAAAAGRMADGSLGATIPEHLPNEIGRVGASVNSLAVNFQEVLILVWNQTEDALSKIRRTTHQITPGGDEHVAPDIVAELNAARQDLETMQMMVRSFDLYDVAITDNDVLTAKGAADTIN